MYNNMYLTHLCCHINRFTQKNGDKEHTDVLQDSQIKSELKVKIILWDIFGFWPQFRMSNNENILGQLKQKLYQFDLNN